MAIIACTRKLLNELKTKPSDELEQSDSIVNWHANLLWIDRRKCVLFTNNQTLYSFFVPGMKKPQFENFDEIFRLHLLKTVMSEDFSETQTEHLLNANKEIRIGKTNNRSVVGSMNELAMQIKYDVHAMGGLAAASLTELNYKLNRIPMGAIDYKFSVNELKRVLNERDT